MASYPGFTWKNPTLPQAILQDRLHVSESTFSATGRVSLERAEEKEAPDDLGKM